MRDKLIEEMIKEVYGPRNGPEETITGNPIKEYVTGIIISNPRKGGKQRLGVVKDRKGYIEYTNLEIRKEDSKTMKKRGKIEYTWSVRLLTDNLSKELIPKAKKAIDGEWHNYSPPEDNNI